jgi:SAM-dependent methyltransferase
MNPVDNEAIRAAVRDHYASIATGTIKDAPVSPQSGSGCCAPSCCGASTSSSLKMGYLPEDILNAPEGADLGLGCGNPQAIASLKPGDIVLDLGAGAGFDAFLAAQQVGLGGRVIGVDMTPAMLAKARHNAAKAGIKNVEFRLGEIEHLPVADASVDVIISNCVINLSPDKPAVFAEAFRVLKPGGRIAVSDIVATKRLPDALARSIAAHAGCIAGAADIGTLEALLAGSGFSNIRIKINEQSQEFIRDWLPGSGAESYVASATIQATKRHE